MGKTSFNLPGIEFDVDLHKIVTLNYDKKLTKIKRILENWSKRLLTPIGKITVIKTLLISQLNHLFISLPNPDNNYILKLNKILYNFIWNGKTDRVKSDILIKDFEGGLKMVELESFILWYSSS